MISVSNRNWKQKKINNRLAEKLKQDYNLSDIVSKLVVARQFDETELNSIKYNLHLNNVFLKNKDFEKSINLVLDSINNDEIICILGDYDVDGSAATSLFIKFFKSLNHPFFYYIPDRAVDGYGATKKLFQKLIHKKPKLIILVDCGSTSNKAIDFLNENNIKSLIIDHHEINHPFPKANMIINPKKNNGYIEYDYFCATTLVYFFLDLLSNRISVKIKISDYLIYVLLATVCDVMPLRKLNRLIALNVLKNFDINKNMPLNQMYKLYNKINKINIDDLGFLVGPILNSGGRLGKSSYASDLLSSNNLEFINKRSNQLNKLNNKRKEIETLAINEIDFNKIKDENKDIIVYFNPTINEGIIGIIAARLKDHFNKPAVVITSSNNLLKGSARSIYNYNIGHAIKSLVDKNIIINGGGHNMAAGFTLKKSKLQTFEKSIIEDFSNSGILLKHNFVYDSEVSSNVFSNNFYTEIKRLEPFGIGNPAPIFLIKNLKVIKSKILNHKHISLVLKSKSGYSIKAISFNSVNNKVGEYLINYKNYLNVLGQINENNWNNKKNLQLTIRDVIL